MSVGSVWLPRPARVLVVPVPETGAPPVRPAALGFPPPAAAARQRALDESELQADTGLWAIVLAGGNGLRMAPLVRHIHGDERPKPRSSVWCNSDAGPISVAYSPLSAIRGLKRVGAEPCWLATLTAQELV